MKEGVQYGGGFLVRMRYTISTGEGVQYGSVTPSVRRRHTFSNNKGVQHRSITPSLGRRV